MHVGGILCTLTFYIDSQCMVHWISYSIVSCAAVSDCLSPADVFKIPSGIPV